VDSLKQLAGISVESAEQLGEGVHAGRSLAPLDLPDRRAVQGSSDRKFFLGEASPPATRGEVAPELIGDPHGSSSQSK
jgi:hypothetical protein